MKLSSVFKKIESACFISTIEKAKNAIKPKIPVSEKSSRY